MINNGEIGAMVLGSWAFSQMVEAGEHGDDIMADWTADWNAAQEELGVEVNN
ncbi:MAG: hypothetical protein NC429_05160 [Lachnospiraceae bacterium]|nr:hypothetical protein [Lachnospiraceae bacterium]